MNIIGPLVFLFTIIPLMAVWGGYVLSVMWSWFIIPVFTGAPTLSIPAAIGISIVISYVTRHATNLKEKEDADFDWYAKQTGKMLFIPLFFLGYGWIIKQFL